MTITEKIQDGIGAAAIDIIDRFYRAAVSRAGYFKGIAQLTFINGFGEYVAQTAVKCGNVKTIISRSAPVQLKEVHVPLYFSIRSVTYEEKKITSMLSSGSQIVISGLAGSGKSMTMRSCYLDVLEKGDSIPVFVELRNVPADEENSLVKYVADQIGNFTSGFDIDAVIFGVKGGHITLLLDGFDEIDRDRKDAIEDQILKLVDICPKGQVMVSGRPDERYLNWPTFVVAEVRGLTKEQSLDVISRVEFDEEIKSNFAARIEDDLFDTHSDVLRNPLLCCMMLLTFSEFAEIPSKMHVFYKTAFDVLIRKHDSLKPRFRRQFETMLESFEFTRLFETFCFLSYSDRQYSFSADAIIDYAREALDYEQVDVSPQKFVDDLVKNVCVILKDGENYSFLHRSFQEYFVASFLLSRNLENFYELIKEVVRPDWYEGPYKFMGDMNREVLIRRFVPQAAKDVRSRLKRFKSETNAIAEFISGFHVYRGGSCGFYWTSNRGLIRIYYTMCHTLDIYPLGGVVVDPVLTEELFANCPVLFDGSEDDAREYVDVSSHDSILFAEVVKSTGIYSRLLGALEEFASVAEDLDRKRSEALKKKIRPKRI